MPQPPVRPIMSRALSRAVPFIAVRTFNGVLGAPGTVSAEFDRLKTFADPAHFNQVGPYPGTNAPKTVAVGPYLDALLWADQDCLIRVEYAVDRDCSYRQPTADVAVPANTPENISALRITGRFVRVSLINNSLNPANVEFGVYVCSA